VSKFTSFFGKLGRVLISPRTAASAQLAGAVVEDFNPGIGSLIEMVAGAAAIVESQAQAQKAAGLPAQSGAAKKDQALTIIDAATPVAVQVLQNVTGKTIADPSALAPSISNLLDDIVELMHELTIFPAHTNGESPAIAPAAPSPAAK
jgi:hypothetical protein